MTVGPTQGGSGPARQGDKAPVPPPVQKVAAPGDGIPKARERLRIDEVARYLDCSDQHVYNLIHEGSLPGQDINIIEGGRPILRVTKTALLEFISKRMVKPGS